MFPVVRKDLESVLCCFRPWLAQGCGVIHLSVQQAEIQTEAGLCFVLGESHVLLESSREFLAEVNCDFQVH